MESCTLVRTEHLNHYGRLFGGQLLRWVDEFAWVAASRQFPGRNLVTRAMADVEFRHQVRNGAILTFRTELQGQGSTSVCYTVIVHAEYPHTGESQEVFSTAVTLVAVDENGHKVRL